MGRESKGASPEVGVQGAPAGQALRGQRRVGEADRNWEGTSEGKRLGSGRPG